MNPGPLLFLAAFFTMSISWFGFVLAPQLQLGRQVEVTAASGDLYPSMRSGIARQGEEIYRANGCFYCHTLQVRPKGFGSDVERGWGARPGVVQSVNEDYLYDQTVMLGRQRVGPDLSNIGVRQANPVALLVHLYNPQRSAEKSVMPPYPYLFERHKLKPGQAPSPAALPLGNALPADEEVVATEEARQLVSYLMSLRSSAVLFETPPPAASTNAPAGATNASVTNAVAPVSPATNASK